MLMLLMAAALAGGDDSDWVRLPSKCEGKRGLGVGRADRRPPAVCSGRGLLLRGCAPAGCSSALLLPAGIAVPGSHLIACRFVAGTGRVCCLQLGLCDASYLSVSLVRRQSRVGQVGHLLPGAVSSVFVVQAHVELNSKEKI